MNPELSQEQKNMIAQIQNIKNAQAMNQNSRASYSGTFYSGAPCPSCGYCPTCGRRREGTYFGSLGGNQ